MISEKSLAPVVLFLDSGSGGLTVWQEVVRQLPQAHTRYIADFACFPYGVLAESALLQRVEDILHSVIAQEPPDVIVIACNTASTIVLNRLRADIQIPIVGVVPAIKPAALHSAGKCIGLLATPGTVQRSYTDNLIREFAHDCDVVRVGSAALVEMCEKVLAGQPADSELLAEEIEPFIQNGCDTVVLGCTHFPLVRPALEANYPQIQWVDSGDAIARRVASLLSDRQMIGQKAGRLMAIPHQAFYTGQPSLERWVETVKGLGFGRVASLT